MRTNHALYETVLAELNAAGYCFGPERTVTLEGPFTTGLVQDYFSLKIEEHVEYLNRILPLTMTASKVGNRIEIKIIDFREHQLDHYTRRLSEAKTVEERAWLRNELYHLKKAI